MKPTTSLLLAATLFFAALPAAHVRASNAPAPDAPAPDAPAPDAHAQLLAHLRSVAQPLTLANGRLDGKGAEWIARESAQAQFVLIGEDHGMADIPRFAEALWNAPGERGFERLVIEAGPFAAAAMTTARDSNGIATLNANYPTAIPFFNWREDGQMAANAIQHGRGAHALCGIDQEFIFSGRLLFRVLADMSPNPAARTLAMAFAERDDALYRDMVAKQDFNLSLFSTLAPPDFVRLRQAFAGRDEALALIADIETSADIYRLQQTDGYRSNAMRSALMKRNFMRCFRDDLRGTPHPRALFRMGAYHVGRGMSPTGHFDIGNLAAELAASNGKTSLHLLVIAAGGTSNRWYPFADDPAAKQAPYNGRQELESVGAVPLLDFADTQRWTLIPLAGLRAQSALRRAGGSQFEQLVYAYDAVVVIPQATAAILYGDPAR